MKSLLFAVAAAVSACPAHAAYVYTPSESSIPNPGNDNTGLGASDANQRTQLVYLPSDFTGAVLISQVDFRFDEVNASGLSYGVFTPDSGYRVIAAINSGGLSTVLNNNLTFGAQTVVQAASPYSMPIFRTLGGAGEVKGWGVSFVFSTPFLYDPAAGNLILDFYIPRMVGYVTLDSVSNGGLGYTLGNSNGSGTGTYQNNEIPVTRFTVTNVAPPPVPEPASWALMIGGLALVGGLLRRRATAVGFG